MHSLRFFTNASVSLSLSTIASVAFGKMAFAHEPRIEVRKPVALLFRFCKSYFGVTPDVVVRSSNPLTVVACLEWVNKSENPCLYRQKS